MASFPQKISLNTIKVIGGTKSRTDHSNTPLARPSTTKFFGRTKSNDNFTVFKIIRHSKMSSTIPS